MNFHCLRHAARAATCGLLLATAAQAQPTAGVYRCGNSYSGTPCAGAQVVAADDPRSDAQRQQTLAARQQDAQLAKEMASERRAREHAAAGQRAARIGPTEAERAHAAALAAKKTAALDAKKKRKKPAKPRKLGTA